MCASVTLTNPPGYASRGFPEVSSDGAGPATLRLVGVRDDPCSGRMGRFPTIRLDLSHQIATIAQHRGEGSATLRWKTVKQLHVMFPRMAPDIFELPFMSIDRLRVLYAAGIYERHELEFMLRLADKNEEYLQEWSLVLDLNTHETSILKMLCQNHLRRDVLPT